MAVTRWRPAPDGASWTRITGAWLTLHALIEAAVAADRKEKSS